MIRTFLAVELDAALRTRLGELQQVVKQRLSRAIKQDIRLSWTRPDSMHLTVKFLGETLEEHVEMLREAIHGVVTPHLPIEIPLERLGVFPQAEQPRVLWVGPREAWAQTTDAMRLNALHREVERCCGAVGFLPERRPLSPHLTLARVKAGRQQVGEALAKSGVMDQAVSSGILTVSSVALMKSELHPTGSVYTTLWEVCRSEHAG